VPVVHDSDRGVQIRYTRAAGRSGHSAVGRISAMLDWELQVLGDPIYDIAYVLSDLRGPARSRGSARLTA
jgi:hypothetical protein